jgi:hypothetical protein
MAVIRGERGIYWYIGCTVAVFRDTVVVPRIDAGANWNRTEGAHDRTVEERKGRSRMEATGLLPVD